MLIDRNSLFIFALLSCIPANASTKVFNIRDLGAKGDGVSIDSQVINDAIHEPSAHGIQPAWGLSMSYVHGIRLKRVRMNLLTPDGRDATYIGPDVQKMKKRSCNL